MATNRLLAATAAGVFLSGGFLGFPRPAGGSDSGTRARQLLGSRYEKMLGLASYLNETAQGALQRAADDVRRGSPGDAWFLPAMRAFAASTRDLLRTMSERQATSLELPSQVADLQQRARLMGERIRAAHALEIVNEDWEAMADALRRMALLLEGHDVDVPNAYAVPLLAGSTRDEIRRLASELESSASRAHGQASRSVRKYADRGHQFLGELRHFVVQSRDLRGRLDADKVDAQHVGPVVDHVLAEARQADRRMREARVFTEVWDDSGRSILILQRMANLVRSGPRPAAESRDIAR